MWKPDDWHEHLRFGAMLRLVMPFVARRFHIGLIMPNLDPPITTCLQLQDYDDEIVYATGWDFIRMLTMYLTDTLDPEEVRKALRKGLARAIKYYPPGLTTNSDKGVKNPSSLWTPGTKPYESLRVLAEHNGVFLIHAADALDKNGEELDPYDQEKHFLKETLPRIIDAHDGLKISVEHMSTADGADEMRYLGKDRPGKIGCSLTAHHLLLARRDVFRGGFRPHRSWMPVIQSAEHQKELRKFAAEDHPFVWLGSDSAPHTRDRKESDCCASGVMMAHAGIELYVEAFDKMDALDDRFVRFACVNGRKFFGYEDVPRKYTIELVRETWKPTMLFFGDSPTKESSRGQLVPFRLGEEIEWRLAV